MTRSSADDVLPGGRVVASDPADQRSTFTDSGAAFPTAGEGLTGAVLEIIGGPGVGQQRLILGNDASDRDAQADPQRRMAHGSRRQPEPVPHPALQRPRHPSVTVQVNDNDLAGVVVDEPGLPGPTAITSSTRPTSSPTTTPSAP